MRRKQLLHGSARFFAMQPIGMLVHSCGVRQERKLQLYARMALRIPSIRGRRYVAHLLAADSILM